MAQLHGAYQHERYQCEEQKGKRNVHLYQHGECYDYFDRRDEILFRAVVGKFSDIKQVGRDTRNKLACLVAVIVPV